MFFRAKAALLFFTAYSLTACKAHHESVAASIQGSCPLTTSTGAAAADINPTITQTQVQQAIDEIGRLSLSSYYSQYLAYVKPCRVIIDGATFEATQDMLNALKSDFTSLDGHYASVKDYWTQSSLDSGSISLDAYKGDLADLIAWKRQKAGSSLNLTNMYGSAANASDNSTKLFRPYGSSTSNPPSADAMRLKKAVLNFAMDVEARFYPSFKDQVPIGKILVIRADANEATTFEQEMTPAAGG